MATIRGTDIDTSSPIAGIRVQRRVYITAEEDVVPRTPGELAAEKHRAFLWLL